MHEHRKKLFLQKTDQRGPDECWLWTGSTNEGGYGLFYCPEMRLHRGGELANRAAWFLFRGPIPEGQQVLHSCDTPGCVNYEKHLFLGTNLDNVIDRETKRRGVRRCGEESPHVRLTEDQVREIRDEVSKGRALRAVAIDFGVSHTTVGRIARRTDWRHVA